mgnify:CR=1 FL=1
MVKKIIACSDIHIRNLKRMDETFELLGKFIAKCIKIQADNKLERDEMEMILDYLNEFSLIEEVKVNDKNYVLVHAGLLRNDLRLDLLRVEECVFASTPLTLANRTIVCGHTPTSSGCIEFSQGQIHIDCGCVFNGQLGVLCLDTLQTFYVN